MGSGPAALDALSSHTFAEGEPRALCLSVLLSASSSPLSGSSLRPGPLVLPLGLPRVPSTHRQGGVWGSLLLLPGRKEETEKGAQAGTAPEPARPWELSVRAAGAGGNPCLGGTAFL